MPPLRGLLATALLGAVLLACSGSAACAHAILRETVPADSSRLDASPPEVAGLDTGWEDLCTVGADTNGTVVASHGESDIRPERGKVAHCPLCTVGSGAFALPSPVAELVHARFPAITMAPVDVTAGFEKPPYLDGPPGQGPPFSA